ncbi:MAG: methionyl-tRNA formyltransferase [Candidatus Dactylopiibacterium carminicum]|uniref:Methionyl-tRNA formyltransferase n=1 Tax=Candidatus Dactylopiibacterium carminicum TaxID=857335 RepID=A0A272EZ46_9RHOO|nr:methionyl-tRNA formyltransferase [Candidatus Dactylopiibacterium carminicum]KAF7600807.1 methionyl-tRNA formyltransferase [Candidatus Dactylopiibacterium carminicum]PAS95306.1 MAG: methionyl-tRNA formyltransferase [Candidatus Dactylopiibacterium carminicum]PAS98682.1 MAG: methionyl-tRNA formyltransferase [Candidatus Dactylopiibacterium carminicum]PAT00814.1 MAG: methionyl-tRNA formyltransferase [Candidatus Dactylopiibacterium carminicum]
MKVAFAGTPEFAAVALRAILAAGFDVPLVLTQPDRPAGRGMQLQPSAVKQVALANGIAVDQPDRLRTSEQQAVLADCAPDVLVVAAYGLILAQAVLDLPRFGCLNIHGSLLPRWRGAAPIHRAIEAGDEETGITLMQMEAGLDTGPMLLKRALPILPIDTTGTLQDKLAVLGGEMIVEALHALENGPLPATIQPEQGVTYAHKIDKAESQLDFRQPAAVLARKLRAFDPFPGGAATIGGTTLKLWAGKVGQGEGDAGTVLAADASGVLVACGDAALRLTVLQKPGSKRLPVGEFLRGFPLSPGLCFDLPGD